MSKVESFYLARVHSPWKRRLPVHFSPGNGSPSSDGTSRRAIATQKSGGAAKGRWLTRRIKLSAKGQGRHQTPPSTPSAHGRSSSSDNFQAALEGAFSVDPSSVILVLKTLAHFNMNGMILLPFIDDVVTQYLEVEDASVRLQAVKTISELLKQNVCALSKICGEDVQKKNRSAGLHRAFLRMCCSSLRKLLVLAVADRDPYVRKVAIVSLDPVFDDYLSQSDLLKPLSLALNDEEFEIRELAISVIGRLTNSNPAYVMPSLRKVLVDLLLELQTSYESRSREESSHLLCHLIRASKKLVAPYSSPILKVLMPRLRDPSTGVAISVLRTLGELSVVAGDELRRGKYLQELIPIIIETIQDKGNFEKRIVALRTLSQLVSSTGLAGSVLYSRYKSLLGTLLSLAAEGNVSSPWALREELFRTIGTLGALDPYAHRQNVKMLTEKRARNLSRSKKAGADSGVGGVGGSSSGRVTVGGDKNDASSNNSWTFWKKHGAQCCKQLNLGQDLWQHGRALKQRDQSQKR